MLARDPDPDPERWTKEGRQFSVMSAAGEVATHTGPRASEWAGHRIGEHCSAQGNILAGPAVVDDMVTAFESTEGHLSLRLPGGAGRQRGQPRIKGPRRRRPPCPTDGRQPSRSRFWSDSRKSRQEGSA